MSKNKNKKMKQLFCAVMACALTASVIPTTVFATDSIPMTGEQARKANQPKFSGYRVWDIRDWSPEEDPGAEFMRAKIPLQKRNEQFKPTQANPDLDAKAQIMLMQGDYGNVFSDGMMYNNTFGYYTLNYWQYADYFSPWHGAMTATTPEDLYDRDFEDSTDRGWEKRYFEFGVLNIPNPAYTNAAHKNGVKSIACIYFDQYYRQGQTINELFVQDENGKFPVAEKLIEMANYFGYDGYFFNAEEAVAPKYQASKKLFLKTLEDAGLYTQYYDVNSTMNESKEQWLNYDVDGDGEKEKIQDSVFVNYGWNGNLDRPGVNFDYIEKNGLDPFEQVFYGVEANQGGFHGGHRTAREIEELYAPGTKNPRASLALFTPSDYYQRALDKDKLQNTDYQWMIEERERMYYSGVMKNPTDTGDKAGHSRPDVFLDDASKWVGVADFTSERSVINGSNFYSNFNTGKGVQYFVDGKVSADEEWSNINIQDIPLTWQWWFDVEGDKSSLNADFDYGTKETRRDKDGNLMKLPFTQIGAYEGGSSLVVYGDITAKNTMHLYKTDLDVKDSSEVKITYKKSSNDNATMKLGLVFKDEPKKVVELDIKDSQTKGEWTTATVDLSKYKGKQIATIDLVFDGTATNYQMNIGEIVVTDGKKAPAKPTGFTISRAFEDDEMIVNWDIADFNEVDKYEITATLSNGEKMFVGGIYDNIYYIKSLLDEQKNVKLELVAVGKNGEKSEPAVVNYDFSKTVSNLKATEEKKEVIVKEEFTVRGSITQSAEEGALNLTWENPAVPYENLEITVTLDDNKDKESKWTQTVEKGKTSARIEIPHNAGETYNASVVTVFEDGTKGNPVNITGKLKDTTVESYDPDKVELSGNTLTFWCPDPNDWFKIHAKFEGEPLSFSNRFGSFGPAVPNAIRAATKMTTTIPSNTGTLEIVLEDYAGNFSAPANIYFMNGVKVTDKDVIDESDFPDEALRQALKEKVSDKLIDILQFNGTLDLTNVPVKDLTGLNKISSLKGLILDGTSVSSIDKGVLPNSLEKLSLKDMPNLTNVNEDALKGFDKLKDVDITGSTKLSRIYLNGLGLDNLKTSKGSEYKDIYVLDISDNKLNLSEDTSEGSFIKELEEYTTNNPVTPEYGNLQNIALQKPITSDSWMKNPTMLVDGDVSDTNMLYLSNGKNVTIDLGSSQDLEEIKVYFQAEKLKGTKFTLQASQDNKTWTDVKVHTDSNPNTDTIYDLKLDEKVNARYFRYIANDDSTCITEIELYARPYEQFGVFYNNQRPSVKIDLDENMSVQKVKTDVEPINAMDYLTKAYENVMLLNGKPYSTVEGASWIAQGYNPKVVPQGAKVSIKNLKGEDVANPMQRVSGVYSITYSLSDGNVLGQTKLEIIDVDMLDEAIAIAEEIKAKHVEVSEDLMANLDTALNVAKEVRAKEFTTFDEVSKATKNLFKAILDLNTVVEEKEKLQSLYDDSLIVMNNLDRYIEQGKDEFKQAVDNAKAVLDKQEATAQEISKAWNDLATAIADLEVSPDKSALQLLVNEYSEIDLSVYTPSSVEKFNTVMEKAKSVLEDKNATQETVDTTIEELKAVKEQLVMKAEKSELKAVIDSVANLVADNYTAESWDNLQKSLDKANLVFADENATQDEVNNAKLDLQTAINSLVKKPENPDPNPNPNPDPDTKPDNKPENKPDSKPQGGDKGESKLPGTSDDLGIMSALTAVLGALGLASVIKLKRRKEK